jgi:hypothetical protein
VRILRGASLAEFAPDRLNLSLFRLAGFLLLRGREPRPAAGEPAARLARERHVNVVENYSFAAVAYLLMLFFAADLALRRPAGMSRTLLLVLSPLWAVAVWNVWYVIVAIVAIIARAARLMGSEGNLTMQTTFTYVLMTGASLWFAINGGFAALAAVAWLSLVAANGVAALVLLPLRDEVAELSRKWDTAHRSGDPS